MNFQGVFFGFFAILLLSGFSLAGAAGAEQIQDGTCELFRTVQVVLSAVVFLLIVGAAAVYAGSAIWGFETRSRAAVWATSMILGSLIGILIYLLLPFIMSTMFLEDSLDAEVICPPSDADWLPRPIEPVPPLPPIEEPIDPDDPLPPIEEPIDPDDPNPPIEEPIDPDDPLPPIEEPIVPPEDPIPGVSECTSHSDCARGGHCSYECMFASEVGDIAEHCPGDNGGICLSYSSCGCYSGECKWEETPEYLECLEDPPVPECFSDGDCGAGGTCSMQCMDADEVGPLAQACPGVSESVCYQYTSCGCDYGLCAWDQTPEFLECIEDPPPNPIKPECIIDVDCEVGGSCGSGCFAIGCPEGEICMSHEYIPCVGSGIEGCYGSYGTCGCNSGICGWEPSSELDECLEDPPTCVGTLEGCDCQIGADCKVGGMCGSACYSPASYTCEEGEICEGPPEYVSCVGSGMEACYSAYGSCDCNSGTCGWEPSLELDECLNDQPACVGTQEGCDCLIDADCVRAGCTSELCVAADEAGGIVSTCDYKDEYNCFPLSSCGCNAGKCAWDQNPEYLECVESPPGNIISPE